MKIGINSPAYNYWGDEGYKKLAAIGYSAIDFNLTDTEKPVYSMPEDEFTSYLLHHKELAEEAGIEISQVHGPWRWPTKDRSDEDRAERMEKMKKSIKACAILGCKYWVIHPIMPFTHQDTLTGDGEKTWKINLEFFRKLLPVAKEHGVTICFENMPMPQLSVASPSEILKFVREIDDENFKICLDTGHVAVYKDMSLGDAVRELGSQIKVLHVHDNDGKVDRHMIPYFGVIDWADFGKALKDIAFDGVLSLETAPSAKLPPDIFEEMCKSYYKIAKSIID